MQVSPGPVTLDRVNDPRCPRCQAPPPALATCDACEEGHAPFVTAGACPRCALVWDRLECVGCAGWTRLELWLPDDGERRAFLERLLGPRGVEWEKVLATTTRALGADVGALLAGGQPEPSEDEERAAARVEVLEAEDAVAPARRGEGELAALAPEATSAALAPELEAARRASRAAVEAALRALDDARRRAEALNRRGLDATRADPVEPPPPAEVTPNGPHAARCPACGWQPDGCPRWLCTRAGCDTRFDAFATGARCPACARAFATTRCCVCDRVAAPEAWWRAGGASPPGRVEEPARPVAAEPAVAGWLASKVAGLLDRGDATQAQVAASLERAAGVTDRTLERLRSFAASLGDDGTAMGRIQAGDFAGAVEECTRALRRDPGDAAARARRGLARSRMGHDAEALADLSAALASDALAPAQRAWALRVRASLRSEVDDHEGAIADATQAIALEPDDASAYWTRSIARGDLRQLDAALADADEAVRRASDPTGPLAWRTWLHHARGDAERAEADATALLEHGPSAAALYYRADARLRLGRPDDALADARRALRLDPTLPSALYRRATARREANDALVDLRRLRRVDPWGRRSWWFALAVEAHLAGDDARARRLLRDARDHQARAEYGAVWLWLLLGDDGPWPVARDDGPGSLARLARGELDLDAFLARASTLDDPLVSEVDLRAEGLCVAGARAERAGDAGEAARLFRACVDTGVGWGVERLWATLRLAGVKPRAPRPSTTTPTAAPAIAPASSSASSLADQLERLARLRDQGVLDDAEFALAKRRLLGL